MKQNLDGPWRGLTVRGIETMTSIVGEGKRAVTVTQTTVTFTNRSVLRLHAVEGSDVTISFGTNRRRPR